MNATPSRDVWQARQQALADLIASKRPVSAPFVENGAPRVIAAVYSDNGILAGAFALPPLVNVGIGEHGVTYLVDAQGRIIVHPEARRLAKI